MCRTRNVDLVRSLGAEHVVDYTRDDVAASGSTYDVVLDLVGNRSLRDLRRLRRARRGAGAVRRRHVDRASGRLLGPRLADAPGRRLRRRS